MTLHDSLKQAATLRARAYLGSIRQTAASLAEGRRGSATSKKRRPSMEEMRAEADALLDRLLSR